MKVEKKSAILIIVYNNVRIKPFFSSRYIQLIGVYYGTQIRFNLSRVRFSCTCSSKHVYVDQYLNVTSVELAECTESGGFPNNGL